MREGGWSKAALCDVNEAASPEVCCGHMLHKSLVQDFRNEKKGRAKYSMELHYSIARWKI